VPVTDYQVGCRSDDGRGRFDFFTPPEVRGRSAEEYDVQRPHLFPGPRFGRSGLTLALAFERTG
jgi:hypothetical protein